MVLGIPEIVSNAGTDDAGTRLVADPPADLRPLSAREHQVIALIGEGKSRKEVAFELKIAHATVRVLYSRARKKLQPRPAAG